MQLISPLQWELSTQNRNVTLNLCKFRFFRSFNPTGSTLHPSKHLLPCYRADSSVLLQLNLPSSFAIFVRTYHKYYTSLIFHLSRNSSASRINVEILVCTGARVNYLRLVAKPRGAYVLDSIPSTVLDCYFPRFMRDKRETGVNRT